MARNMVFQLLCRPRTTPLPIVRDPLPVQAEAGAALLEAR